jgi:hypothetical protein
MMFSNQQLNFTHTKTGQASAQIAFPHVFYASFANFITHRGRITRFGYPNNVISILGLFLFVLFLSFRALLAHFTNAGICLLA